MRSISTAQRSREQQRSSATEHGPLELPLGHALPQIPIGVESDCKGIIDIVERKAYQFVGAKGNVVEEMPVPGNMAEEVILGLRLWEGGG